MRSRRAAGQGLGFLADDAAERAVYVISVAAELAGMHPQTLRQYDRLGLVSPARTSGHGRRYSRRDVERLRRVQALSQEGVNLEGIRRILDLELRLEAAERENRLLRLRQEAVERVFAVAADGEVQVVPARSGRAGRKTSRRRAEDPAPPDVAQAPNAPDAPDVAGAPAPAPAAAASGSAAALSAGRPGCAVALRAARPVPVM